VKKTTLFLALCVALPALAVDLPAAVQSAQAVDPTLASARANRDAATENIGIARARLLPQLSYQGTYQQLDQNTKTALGSSNFNGPSKNSTVSLRQGVFRPRDWAGLTIGKLQAEYGEYKLDSALADLWNRTVFAWVDVLAATSQRDAYARGVTSAQAAAEQERKRFLGGDSTRDAMAEAAAQLAQSRALLADAEMDLQGKSQAFKLLTRLEATGFERMHLPNIDRLPVVLPTQEDALQRVLDTNPELLAAQIAAKVAERRLEQAREDHMPTLDFIGSATKAESDNSSTIGQRYRNGQLGVQLVVPIFSGGGLSAAQRQQAAFYAAALSDRDSLEQKLRTQVSSDWQSLAGMKERVRSSQELLAAAREQKRAAELGLKLGAKTWSDVSSADQLVARRESDLIGLSSNVLKIQSRLLSLLPVTEPVWEQWTREVSALVQ
jgi:protease secretion system outer membrane protein